MEWYVTQEKALAPGIAGEWPKAIEHPTSQHGRLVRVDALDELLIAADSELSAIAHGRPCDVREALRISDGIRKARKE